MPYVTKDVLSPILRAYYDAYNSAIGEQQRQFENEQSTKQMQLREKAQKEDERQFNEQMKRYEAQQKEQERYHDLMVKQQKLALDQAKVDQSLRLTKERNDYLQEATKTGAIPRKTNPEAAMDADYEGMGRLVNKLFGQKEFSYPTTNIYEGNPYVTGNEGVINPEQWEAADSVYNRGEQVKQQQEIQAQRNAEMSRIADEARRSRERMNSENNATRIVIEDKRGENRLAVANAKLTHKDIMALPDTNFQELLDSGEVMAEDYGVKEKASIIARAVKLGSHLQRRKEVEKWKELKQSRDYIEKLRELSEIDINDPKTAVEFLAKAASVKQGVGAIGAAFPMLGKLSDRDVALLEKGLPPTGLAKELFTQLTGPYGKHYKRLLVEEGVKAYASSLDSSMANVSNVNAKARVLKNYGLNLAGIQKYLKRGK